MRRLTAWFFWLVGVIRGWAQWTARVVLGLIGWIKGTGWPWAKDRTAPLRAYLRQKRSPVRKMRAYDSVWRLLVLFLVAIILTWGIVKGSHLMCVEILRAEPKLLCDTPRLRGLILDTYTLQVTLSLILVGVWFIGLRRSNAWGIGFVPTQFLKRVDDAIALHEPGEFAKAFRELMRHRSGRKGATNLDLLVRTVVDDHGRRRDLYYHLDRSRTPVAKRYLVMRCNEAAIWSLWVWLMFFFYAHLFLPFLVLPAGRLVPGAIAFLQGSPEMKTLAAIGTLLTLGRAFFSAFKSIQSGRSDR